MRLGKPSVFIAFAFCCPLLWAGPAAWYLWRSPENSFPICSQISPGDDWQAVKGPFQDSVCRKPGVPH
jgi:hypothetical protein